MARALRVEYPGAIYHVMSRGNHGDPIYRDDKDREAFLKCLGEACGKTGWAIHAFVLMGNHYHLLLETPKGNLVAGMKWLQGRDLHAAFQFTTQGFRAFASGALQGLERRRRG